MPPVVSPAWDFCHPRGGAKNRLEERAVLAETKPVNDESKKWPRLPSGLTRFWPTLRLHLSQDCGREPWERSSCTPLSCSASLDGTAQAVACLIRDCFDDNQQL